MSTWTRSAYGLLAWITLPIVLIMIGLAVVAQPAQANIRIADVTQATTAAPDTNTTSSAATTPVAATAPQNYQVAPGDTLSEIAQRLGVPGGWQALYAANRAVIGADPDLLHPGATLTVPAPPTSAEAATPPQAPAPPAEAAPVPATPPAGQPTAEPQANARAPAASGPVEPASMPRWLTTLLPGVGLMILLALLGEPAVAGLLRRWRARPLRPNDEPESSSAADAKTTQARPGLVESATVSQQPLTRLRPVRMVFATHERLLVTHSPEDDAVVVLCPPGQDPREILRVAAVVLPERAYRALANHLGLAAQAGLPPLLVASG